MIIVGLGNPGAEYEGTRHNIGLRLALAAHAHWGGGPWRRRPLYRVSGFRLSRREHLLIRPETFMNCSGEVVARLLQEGATPAELLILLDDIDLPFGRLRLRTEGGAGGHRGLASIRDELRPADVARLRIGVGRPPELEDAADHVLSCFTAEEAERLPAVLDRALEALDLVLREGVVAAMNRFNGLAAPWDEAPARPAARGAARPAAQADKAEGEAS